MENNKVINSNINTKLVPIFENLISIEELLSKLPKKRSDKTIYRWCDNGMPFYITKMGRLFSLAEVCQWLERSH